MKVQSSIYVNNMIFKFFYSFRHVLKINRD